MAELRRSTRRLEWNDEAASVELEWDGTSATFRGERDGVVDAGGSLCWIDGADGLLRVHSGERSSKCHVLRVGDSIWVHLDGTTWRFRLARAGQARRPGAVQGKDPELRAPMTGTIRRLEAHSGEQVSRGQALIAIEAMKMEHVLKAPFDATVEAVLCRQGETVDLGAVLLRLAPIDPKEGA